MGKLFAVDGKLVAVLGRIADLVVLNLLWLLCSLPVVTIGASTTALYAVLLKMVKNEDSYLFSSFWKAFKENFRQSVGIWMGILLTWVVLYFDFYYSSHAVESYARLLVIPLGFVTILTMVLYSYIFPVLAYFENSIKNAVKNAMMMGIAYLPYTIVILFMNMCPILLLFSGNLVAATFFDLVIGFALAAYINAWIFRKLFGKIHVRQSENI